MISRNHPALTHKGQNMHDDRLDKVIFKDIKSNKQKMFIQFYCNPESHTYDNGTQSYKRSYSSNDDNTCAVEAHRLLNKPKIQEAISAYRAYIHEMNAFELDWLDNNLRNLYYKAQEDKDINAQHRILKTIGDRIGAFNDMKPNTGKSVPMTPEEEWIASQVMREIMAETQRNKIKKVD